jgi:hypothetical protein
MAGVIAGVVVDSGPGIDAFLWPRLALLRYGRPVDMVVALEELEAAFPDEFVDDIVKVVDELRNEDARRAR